VLDTGWPATKYYGPMKQAAKRASQEERLPYRRYTDFVRLAQSPPSFRRPLKTFRQSFSDVIVLYVVRSLYAVTVLRTL